MTLFVVRLSENKVLTHDGEVQLGIFPMSLDEFMCMAQAEYQETYWIPDSVSHRYKKLSYQKHLRAASIGTKND